MKRKPWYKRVQWFMPWHKGYVGVQVGNRFFGWTKKRTEGEGD